MTKTKSVLKILKRVSGNGSQMRDALEEARINFQVAQLIYDARTRAGLSQKQLADLIGTQQPVIARLEDADYEGHSLTMLRRIAEALDRRIEIRFVPPRRKLQHA